MSNSSVNPYMYLSDRYLIRKIKKYEKIIGRIIRGKSPHLDFNANRAILLTFSDALHTKKTNEFFNKMMVVDSFTEPETELQEN